MKIQKKILVVDDDPGACACLSDMIRYFGFTVECVETCQGALRRLREKRYDGLVTDVWTSDGSGRDILKWLRANGRGEPVILVSANADYDQWIELVNQGAADLLPKPTESAQLKRALQMAMGEEYFTEAGWQPAMGV